MIKTLKKNNKGITLIALVITIVILIILAGIAISLVVGENGILSKGEQAKSDTLNAQIAEEEQMNALIAKVEEYQTGGNGGGGATMPQVAVGETASENSTINGEEGSYSNPVIPKGFKAVDTTTAVWTDASGYQNGLVIEDDTKDPTTQGSQFVWIPVQNYDNFHLIEGYWEGELDTMLTASTPSREAGASKTEYIPQEPNAGANTLLGTDESVAMYASVKKYGGFYIARYEAGINGTTASTDTEDENKQMQDGSVKPVSKAGVGVWNWISWGGDTSSRSATDGEIGNDTADGAVKVARSMYNNPISGSVNSATTVKSTLCYGVQWDAVMNFIDSNYVTGSCASDSFVRNSKGLGNHTGTLAVTGSSDAYAQKNIYDLAGNVREWTMEAYGTANRVIRGGLYGFGGSDYPASFRGSDGPGNTNMGIGLRVTLYL